LNVCWNNVYRKVFNMRMWDSVKEIQMYCERLDLVRILHKHSFNFFNTLFQTHNCIIRECFWWIRKGKQFHDLCNEYDVAITNNFLYHDVYARFATLCSG